MSPDRLLLTLILSAGLASASCAARADPAPVTEAFLTKVQSAIDEQRFVDAGRWLDEARLTGARDPRLALADGNLGLARGQFAYALQRFQSAEPDPAAHAASLEGQGLALVALGQYPQATETLNRAVGENPKAWRAWNALGRLHDQSAEWPEAKAAYETALAVTTRPAVVLNNRGYSRLLQGQRDSAMADFIDALKREPGLTPARTNLRLALALDGDYDRALLGSSPAEQATLLNNAGFAAAVRGDLDKADDLLNRALKAQGTFYARASDNLKIVAHLSAKRRINADANP